MTEKKPKDEKPKPKRDTTNWKPARQLGRVDDETWQMLVETARKKGKTFTQWALEVLEKAAKRG